MTKHSNLFLKAIGYYWIIVALISFVSQLLLLFNLEKLIPKVFLAFMHYDPFYGVFVSILGNLIAYTIIIPFNILLHGVLGNLFSFIVTLILVVIGIIIGSGLLKHKIRSYWVALIFSLISFVLMTTSFLKQSPIEYMNLIYVTFLNYGDIFKIFQIVILIFYILMISYLLFQIAESKKSSK